MTIATIMSAAPLMIMTTLSLLIVNILNIYGKYDTGGFLPF